MAPRVNDFVDPTAMLTVYPSPTRHSRRPRVHTAAHPPPSLEAFAGPFEDSSFTVPFVASTVQVQLNDVGGERDTQQGSYNFSTQDNVFFTGNNGLPDGDQFTNQAKTDGSDVGWSSQVFTDNVCVWQVLDVEVNGTVPNGNYNSRCLSVNTPYTGLVQGFTRDNDTRSGSPVQGWRYRGSRDGHLWSGDGGPLEQQHGHGTWLRQWLRSGVPDQRVVPEQV